MFNRFSTAIAVAPNGGRRTKADHPRIPLTAAEIARDASECLDAGACMVHVHVRRPDGAHLLDAEAYRQAIDAVRADLGQRIIIQITSEALGLYRPAEQMDVVRAVKPEAVSLALRELVPDTAAEKPFADFLTWMRRQNVLPQIILYEPEEAERLADLQARGLIAFDHVPVLYVLGRYTVDQTACPADLLPFLAAGMPTFRHWSVCAFGRHEAACVVGSALLGGHARVGFENNLYRPEGPIAKSNADLVSATRAAIEACGLKIATADEMRVAMAG